MTDKDLLNEEGEDDFRARMYGNNDEDEDDAPAAQDRRPDAPPKPTGILSMPALTKMVRDLTAKGEEQDHRIKRLEGRLRVLDRATARVGRAVNELDVEVGNKIDKRGD